MKAENQVDEESLFSIWFSLPEQTIPAFSRAAGEKALIFELLCGALHDLESPAPRVRDHAEWWLLNGGVGLITAEEACDFLDISYETLRRRVEQGLYLKRRRRDCAVRAAMLAPSSSERVEERAPSRDRRYVRFGFFA